MPTKRRIRPGEKVPLKLTEMERKLLLDGVLCLDREYEELIQDTPAGEPVMISLDDVEDFGGYVAAEANHSEKQKQKKLDAIFAKTQKLLETYTDDEPPEVLRIKD